MGAGLLSFNSITMVRVRPFDGTSPWCPYTAVPSCESDTETKSCFDGGNALVVSRTTTRSLSIKGSVPWLTAGRLKATANRASLSMRRLYPGTHGRPFNIRDRLSPGVQNRSVVLHYANRERGSASVQWSHNLLPLLCVRKELLRV